MVRIEAVDMERNLPAISDCRTRLGRRAAIAALAFLCLAASKAPAQRSLVPPPPSGVFDEFRYVGKALVCISGGELRRADQVLSPCLHIGAIALEETTEEAEDRLGTPWRVYDADAGAKIHVYPLQGNDEASPYLAVTFKAGRVTAIQLTGEETPEPYSFAGLRLGDSIRRLKDVLGPRTAKEKLENSEATLLSYLPFPISIEVMKKRIVSIKIWEGHS